MYKMRGYRSRNFALVKCFYIINSKPFALVQAIAINGNAHYFGGHKVHITGGANLVAIDCISERAVFLQLNAANQGLIYPDGNNQLYKAI